MIAICFLGEKSHHDELSNIDKKYTFETLIILNYTSNKIDKTDNNTLILL